LSLSRAGLHPYLAVKREGHRGKEESVLIGSLMGLGVARTAEGDTKRAVFLVVLRREEGVRGSV